MNERLSPMGRLFGRRRKTPGLAPTPPDWRLTIRARIFVGCSLLALWAVAIEARLVFLQVYDRDFLEARAEKQSQSRRRLLAARGDIVDRNGEVLATSVDAESIWADPSEIEDRAAAIDALCGALRDCTKEERREFLKRLENGTEFANIRRQATPDQAERVRALKIKGFGTDTFRRRYYPNGELAAHVLGFVGDENKGLGGIESDYDSQILGQNGEVRIRKDARRRAFERIERPPTTGATVELTIDKNLQHLAERELHAGVTQDYRAAGGSVVIMDPRTGEILAMANEPTFNPNAFGEFSRMAWRNRAVQDLYEPGSTFKVVTVSAAIEEKVMPLSTMIDTNPGVIRIGSRVIDEYHGHNYHVLSFSDVIVRSSNVGAVKIGFRVGTDRLSRFVERYGFGRRVSRDFVGENAGIVWKAEQWTDSALASVAMGYQISVTPLQVVAAFSAIANGGRYIEPRVVRALYKDGRRIAVRPNVVRRAISEETAATLTTIMEGVVGDPRGTAKAARIPGYTIAGKTGTAEKLINGRYSSSAHNVSFAGFLPSRKPELAIIVMIDTPTTGGNAGGAVAAPIFKRIAEAALRDRGIAPSINPEPPVLVARTDRPAPMQTAVAVPEPAVRMTVETPPGTVPDLNGMSLRDANRRLARLGLTPQITGDGVVVAQSPDPGTPIDGGTRLRIVLNRVTRRDIGTAGDPR